MRTARTRLAFSVLIVIAMVSSGFGIGYLSATRSSAPTVSGPTGSLDTRSDGTPPTPSLSGSNLNEVQEDNLPTETTDNAVDTDNLAVERIADDTLKENMRTNGITATIKQNEPIGTRNPFFEAGGPYGGPGCDEGTCTIYFEITTDDPTLIFFRWDWQNDGVWDTPWSTDMIYPKLYLDNYYGNVKAEGWDGISTRTLIFTGTNLLQLTNIYWWLHPLNTGWKFRAKVDMTATDLGMYRYYPTLSGLNLRLWDFATKAQLARCNMPSPVAYSWNWCTLSTPVSLTMDKVYMISEHINYNYYYFVGLNTPSVPWDKVEYQNFWYAWNLPWRIPDQDNGGGVTYVPSLDFKWRQVIIEPITQQDTAFVDVNNVAPIPFDLVTDPSPALEGTPVKMSAKFNDPGTEDTWEYRYDFGDGAFSPWAPVKKFSGGANVLLYHTADLYMPAFRTSVIAMCGEFCLKVDAYNFQATPMTLAQLMAYDVVVVDTYSGATPAGTGDLLANYMDAKGNEGSGGVIVTGRGPYNPGSWQITGRYFTDQYSPVPYGTSQWLWKSLGTIYVPHPILNGVTSINAYPHSRMTTVNPGATRIADWTDGAVLLATKTNPKVPNGARAVAMPFRAANTPAECTGDCVKIVVNAIRWASRLPDPVPLTMPIQLPWASHLYKDDDPVTTSPSDDITVRVQVRDDDHLKVVGVTTLVFSETFESCTGSYPNTVFPPGWSKTPANGWQCLASGYQMGTRGAYIEYGWNDPAYGTGDGNSFLASPTFDMTGYMVATVQFYHYWQANYDTVGWTSDGWVQASTDGGATYPYTIAEYHHNNPATDGPGVRSFTNYNIVGSANVKLRLHYYSYNDWYWAVDNINVYGTKGKQYWGLGEGSGTATIANVPPSIVGGPAGVSGDEPQDILLSGMAISDPALMQPTEWFAYKFDFDDGTPTQWVYKGSMAPPKQDILVIHSFCLSDNSCVEYVNFANALSALDVTGSVTGFNFLKYPSPGPTAPSLAYMLTFDVIVFHTHYGYSGTYPPWDAARILIGNNMASYLDAHRGGVVTFMSTYGIDTGSTGWILMGRYMDQDYGPFELGSIVYAAPVLGTVHNPSHPVMEGVSDVWGTYMREGDLATTAYGQRLASNTGGGAFVGVSEAKGDPLMRAVHIGIRTGFGFGGAGFGRLLRQSIGWAIGGLPGPGIPPVTHAWGDNGVYTVDITVIDDDMGWTWDSVNNKPLASPIYPQSLAHRYIDVSVNNVDPTIRSTGAYAMADLCIRLSGNKGNTARMTIMGTDGTYETVETTREPGKPQVACLDTVTIDMTPSTKYTFTIEYDPTGDDGANPEWVFQSTWPGGKIKELRHTFDSNNGYQIWTIGNKEFKRLAIGAELTFSANAYDPGSDDLAFAWVWGDALPYDIHIYAHPGNFYTYASSDELPYLPYSEPWFDFWLNDKRTPEVDPISVGDTAKHTFLEDTNQFLYVMVIVADDDVGDPYPSTYLTPGMDIEVIQLDW